MGKMFGLVLDILGSLMDFISGCMNFDLSSQIFYLLNVAVIVGFFFIWHAHNKCRFGDVLVSSVKAWTFILKAVKQANNLQGGTMRNSMVDLLVFKELKVEGFHSQAPKIIHVVLFAPCLGWIKICRNEVNITSYWYQHKDL